MPKKIWRSVPEATLASADARPDHVRDQVVQHLMDRVAWTQIFVRRLTSQDDPDEVSFERGLVSAELGECLLVARLGRAITAMGLSVPFADREKATAPS